jgi:hypothetical protein
LRLTWAGMRREENTLGGMMRTGRAEEQRKKGLV